MPKTAALFRLFTAIKIDCFFTIYIIRIKQLNINMKFGHEDKTLADFVESFTNLTLDASQRLAKHWKIEAMRKLIDSILNGFFIPEITLGKLRQEPENHPFSIIDGQHRLHTIDLFVRNMFSIIIDDIQVYYNEVPVGKNGRVFSELEATKFGMYPLRIAKVRCNSREEKIEQFKRLNSSSCFKPYDHAWMMRGANALMLAINSVLQGVNTTLFNVLNIQSSLDSMLDTDTVVKFQERDARDSEPRTDLLYIIPFVIAALEGEISALCTQGMTDPKKLKIIDKQYDQDQISSAIEILNMTADCFPPDTVMTTVTQKFRSFTKIGSLVMFDIMSRDRETRTNAWWRLAIERCEREDGKAYFKNTILGYNSNKPIDFSLAQSRTEKLIAHLGESPELASF